MALRLAHIAADAVSVIHAVLVHEATDPSDCKTTLRNCYAICSSIIKRFQKALFIFYDRGTWGRGDLIRGW